MYDQSKSQTTEADRKLRAFRWLLMDALDHARAVAMRSQEATEGTPDTLLFEAARAAIHNFAHEHPTMQALASAAVRSMK